MTVVETHAQGTFCWADLGTTDPAAAKRFYSELFGWHYEDRPMGDGGYYTMFDIGGNAVAALFQQDAQQQAQGIPPSWLSYISVDSVDAMAERTRSLGGTVLMEPFDVLDVGRMTLIQDPTGAMVALWEPRRHIGAEVVGEPNTMCWNELLTTDTAKAGSFYSRLLGWELDAGQYSHMKYTVFKQGERMNGGMMALTPEMGQVPPHWMLYFAVENCDAGATAADRLGGSVHVPPTDIPGVGRFAMIRDPQGAFFSILQSA